VVATRVEFSIDATCFGHRPVRNQAGIQCGRVPLSEEEWLEALGNNGFGSRRRLRDARFRISGDPGIGGRNSQGQTRSKAKRAIVEVQRLQILDWIALRKHGVQVKLAVEDEAVIERLLHFEKIGASLPKHLYAKLHHQERLPAVSLYQHRLGACLADDMGLGKRYRQSPSWEPCA
jgi:non-specific serine/threonine protein kinase